MRLFRCFALVSALTSLGSFVSAQIGTATITGRVTDPTGAVIANVSVTVLQPDTNFQFTATTNEDGLFRVQSLQPGPYRVTFETGGFKRLVRDNIDLRVGDTLPVDASMQVGNVSESVEVKSQAQLIETETSAVGAVMEGKTLYKLPLYQRYVNSTLNLVPGVSTGGYAYGGDLGAYHIAGQRNGASSIGLFEDGVSGNSSQAGSAATIKPVQNSVEEVKVLTTVLPAEYGHSAGGVISVVKKSGTNELHGMASDYGRTRRMTHRLFFDKYRNSDNQPNAPNGLPTWFMMPDANVGGPVVLPKIYNGHNKTFFFFGYQKLIEKKAAQALQQTPTEAEKAGDFNFGGIGNPIYDPLTTRQNPDGTWTRDPFPNKTVPLNRIDPVARKILQISPWAGANQPASFSSAGPIGNYLYNEKSRTFFEDFSGRVDHQINQNIKLYGSYTYNHQSGLGRPTNIGISDFDGTNGNLTPFTQQNGSGGNTWVINPSMVNDVRVGYYRTRNDTIVPSFGKNYGQILGIPNINGALLPAFGVPNSSNEQFTPESIYGLNVSGPNRSIGETLSLRDDLTKIKGSHAFKMGYEILKFRLNYTRTAHPSGDFRFDSMTAGLQPGGAPVPNTGNTFAGFLVGAVRQATFDTELTSWLPRSSINSFYFQDDWKVTPTLTLNLGVRYSNESPFKTQYGLMSNFDPTGTDDVTGLKGAIVHPTSALNQRDSNNFQPRIGAAWHPYRKWVFRGGFALNTVDVRFPNARDQYDEYATNTVQQRAPNDPRPLYLLSQGPNPVTFTIRQNGTSPFNGTNFSSRGVTWWDPNLRNPYVLNWNMSAQYEINPEYMVEAVYQGSAGIGLIERWNANVFPVDLGKGNPALQTAVFSNPQAYRPFPQFGDILLRSNFGHSTYHSGTVRLSKRYSRGLVLNAFYTYSKAIDSQDDDNSGSGVAPLQNRSLEKARAGYDRTHRLNLVGTYELPVGKGRRFLNRGGFLNVLLGGYEIAGIQTLESGNPLTFSFTNSPYNYYPTYAGARRPNLVAQPTLLPNWGELGGNRFNQALSNPIIDINNFAYPAPFTPGNSGRNILTGTRLLWSQVSAQKNFHLTERFNLLFRWDFQNPFHNYNFSNPTTTVDLSSDANKKLFGKLTADQRSASVGGQALMNLTLQLRW